MPFDLQVETLKDLPYTISYVIRKKQQVDSFRELPKEKRPTERMIWEGTPEEMEDWLDRVFDRKKGKRKEDVSVFMIDDSMIED